MEPTASVRTLWRSANAPANGIQSKAGSVPASSTIASEEAEKLRSTYTKTATSMIQEAPELQALAAQSRLTCRPQGHTLFTEPPKSIPMMNLKLPSPPGPLKERRGKVASGRDE